MIFSKNKIPMRLKLHRDFERMSFITVHYDYYYAWFVQIMEESMKQIVRGMQKKVLHKYKKWCIIMFDKCINMQ